VTKIKRSPATVEDMLITLRRRVFDLTIVTFSGGWSIAGEFSPAAGFDSSLDLQHRTLRGVLECAMAVTKDAHRVARERK
jgi:hypothetical protein